MLMSKAQYARHRGVSRQTVYGWIAKGEVVVVEGKIDVEETKCLQESPTSVAERYPGRTLELTWAALWEAVRAKDGAVSAPADDAEIEQRVIDAAGELNWGVEFLEDGGVYLDDGDGEHYFQKYDFRQNAELAIALLRNEVCCVSTFCPDDIDDWSEAGIAALAEWARDVK